MEKAQEINKTAQGCTPREVLEEYGIVTVIDKYVVNEEAAEVISNYLNSLLDLIRELKSEQTKEK
jgi:hypothetical protein